MKTALILSPHFPPSMLAGVHRARHLAKGLPAEGWRPVVVRLDPKDYSEAGDPTLEALVSPDLSQVLTRALPSGLTRLVGIGDIGLRGYLGFAAGLRKAVQEYQAKVVLVTGSPFYPMLLTRMVRQEIGLPVVLDFQDPWVSREGALRSLWSKGRIAHRLAVSLEPRALRYASYVTSVSEVQNREMAERYPWLDASRMAAIPIGGDPDDFEVLRKLPIQKPIHPLEPQYVHISYVGTLLPRAAPLVRSVFRAANRLIVEKPEIVARLRLNFVGTSNQPDATGPGPVSAIAREEGVAHLVTETAKRIPYLEALSILANSQGLLIIGSDEPHYTASKIYPCLMSGRPYLSVFHSASSAHEILSAAGGGQCLSFQNYRELPELEVTMAEALAQLCTRPGSFGPVNQAAYLPFTSQGVAGAFARVFDAVVRD